jgi:ACT domain-containing protein
MHAAQARLLLLREGIETRDPDLELELRDLAGILAHVLAEIEQLGRRTR